MTEIKWLDKPEEHDYAAAEDYLSLLVDPWTAEDTARVLERATTTKRKAKDILRASGLKLLSDDNLHVAKDMTKAQFGKKLSPVLLVRTDLGLQIADGYHRVCAVYHLDEDADIPCKLVTMAYA